MAALGLYAAGLVAMLGCSALYNLAGDGPRKALLRRFDHAAIFVMIAGTYTRCPARRGGGCSTSRRVGTASPAAALRVWWSSMILAVKAVPRAAAG